MILNRHSDVLLCRELESLMNDDLILCFCLQRFYKSCGCSNRFDKTHCNRFHTPEYTDTQRRNPVSMRRHYFIIEPFYRYQYNTIRYDSVRFGTIRYDSVRFGTIRYDSVQSVCLIKMPLILNRLVLIQHHTNHRQN